MSLKDKATRAALNAAFDYAWKNPEENVLKLFNLVEKFMPNKEEFSGQRKLIREAIENKNNNWHVLLLDLFENMDKEVMRMFLLNFFLNATVFGGETQNALREKYNCNIPWAILLDPTSACNLHCTGCWAAEYGYKLNLSLEEIDSIIRQGKEMGVYMYIYTGGEPLVRKKDLIKLCEMHPDCEFLSFTNGTLIDEEFANEMLRVKNFVPAISLEGFEEATDFRRGDGVFQKVTNAMKILKEHRLPFGLSCCYTSKNMDSITSEEYIDFVVEQGAKFAWFFHYMPVGKDANIDLLPTPEQRTMIYQRIRKYRDEKPIFLLDFQNDGQYVGGCIAAGRRFLHINANGDVDPCVFIHYSDSNIREKPLLECLRAPLFQAYHDGQPFNDNMLRPCPMLENPEKIREIVERVKAKSTDLMAPESVEELTSKTEKYAENWKPTADELWQKGYKYKYELEEEEAAKQAAGK